MSIGRRLCICVASLGSLCGGNSTIAQSSPTEWYGNVGPWHFKPAVDNGAVLGFLGWIDSSTAIGGNLQVVWYERGIQGDWSAWAWKDGTVPQAMAFVRSHFALPTLWAGDPELFPVVDLDDTAEVDGVTPTAVVEGVPVDDPMSSVMAATPNKVELAGLLSALGWPVAPVLAQLDAASSEVTATCNSETPTINALLDTMTNSVETAYGLTATAAACQTWCWGCFSTTSWPAWSTVSWSLVSTTNVPAGIVCKWSRTRSRTTTYPGQLTFGYCEWCVPEFETQEQTATTRAPAGGTCATPPL